jgi:hypothetical protein
MIARSLLVAAVLLACQAVSRADDLAARAEAKRLKDLGSAALEGGDARGVASSAPSRRRVLRRPSDTPSAFSCSSPSKMLSEPAG